MSLHYEQKKIVNETTHKVYNPKDEDDMKKLCYDINEIVRDLEFEVNEKTSALVRIESVIAQLRR